MNLPAAYRAVDKVLDTLDFNALFAGFHKYKYALCTGSEICLDGKMIPGQDFFRGNTAIEYNGEYLAIWNMEATPLKMPKCLPTYLCMKCSTAIKEPMVKSDTPQIWHF